MTAGFRASPLPVSKTAGAVVTDKQNYACKLDTSGNVVPCTATTDVVYGIIQEYTGSGVTGDAVEVAPVNGGGSSNIYLSGTIATGSLVTIDANGAASADAATNYNIGQLEAGGAVGELGVIRLGNITVKA